MLSCLSLPKKEQELFRLVVTCYETKKYTKGIQTADNILKKFPNHGETQSMKGLIFNCLGKKEEAMALVKDGVRNGVRSHVCWHVFGLVHRSDSNYPEAIKCFMNALRIDETNQNILRDLSWMQVQIRDIEGFVASRNKILENKSNFRASWVPAAVANYMGDQFQVAFDLVTKYRALNTSDKGDAYEEGELLLFQNRCLEKLCKFSEAVEHLKAHEAHITDKLSVKVKLAELEVLLGNFATAKELWLQLVKNQPDNYRFHSGLQAAYLELESDRSSAMFALKRLELPSTVLNLDAAQLNTLKELYTTVMSFHKKSAANKIVLGFCRGSEELRAALDSHMKDNLRSAIPSLFHDICSLVKVPDPNDSSRVLYSIDAADFKQHEVVKIALELVDAYLVNLRKCNQFDAASTRTEPEPPTALLWALYLKTHLLEMSGELDAALEVIDEAIAHTPTAIDMFGKRARLLKKLGNYTAAAIAMDECRVLDLQDRYLNNKTTKYFLRADEIPLAMNTIALFTKHEGDPQQTLYELQCNWYELELAEAYARTKQWGAALRKFYAVRKHFNDYNDDMFDFHGYCMRKVPHQGPFIPNQPSVIILYTCFLQTTLRAYFDTVNMLDNSYTHKFYQRAARGVLKIFLYLHEFPEDVDGLGHLAPAERKKERLKQKKLKKKADDEKAAAEAAAADEGADKDKEKRPKKDVEPDEEILLAKDFMAEAVLWTTVFTKRLASCDAETIALICDLNVRRGEYVQAVDAVRVGLAKYPGDAHLVYSLVRLAAKVKTPGKKTLGPSAPEIRDNVSKLLGCPVGTIDIDAYVTAYTAQAQQANCLPKIFAAIKCKVFQDKAAPATVEAVSTLLGDAALWTGKGVKVSAVLEINKVNIK